MTIAWTGDLKRDWQSLCELWAQSPYVLQSEVGPRWEMPPQHKACIEFATHHSDSKEFLIGQLSNPDPRIAAYAFKCLARVANIRRSEIPDHVMARDDAITTLMHSFTDQLTLGRFIERFFEAYGLQDDLLDEQERSISWQENELQEYKRKSKAASDDQPKN